MNASTKKTAKIVIKIRKRVRILRLALAEKLVDMESGGSVGVPVTAAMMLLAYLLKTRTDLSRVPAN